MLDRDIITSPPATAMMSAWDGVLDQWLAAKSLNTQLVYRAVYHRFFDRVMVMPDQVSDKDARLYSGHLAAKGLAARTINLHLAAMRSFYEHCRQAGHWPKQRLNPFDRINVQRSKTPPKEQLSPKIVDKVFETINLESKQGIRDFALLYTLVASELRAHVVLRLTWGEVRRQLPAGCLNVISHYLKKVGRLEKIGDDDYIFTPLQALAAERLPHIGSSPPDRPITAGQGNKILKKYARRIQYDRAVWLTMLRLCRLPARLVS